jgi:exosortase E/protease (VPEID-CTERM system)
MSRPLALALAAIVFVIELGVIGIVFKHGINFSCLNNWPVAACHGASGVLVIIYATVAAVSLFFILRPAPLRALLSDTGHSFKPFLLNLLGFAISMVPVAFLVEGSGTSSLLPAFAFWITGFAMLLAGIALFIAPFGHWIALLRSERLPLVAVIATGIAAPFLADLLRPIWQLETIASITFIAVTWIITTFGYDVIIDAVAKNIGNADFSINVAPACSGIEGIALVTVFVTLFLVLFREELRFPRALWLYPVGIAISSMLNVVRIAVLLMIGLEGNPDLAVGGFHSHAGWLMFTLVAVGIVLTARSVPALQKASSAAQRVSARQALPPLRLDENAARILPFAIFMFSALLANVFVSAPSAVYPLRALAMAAALAFFWQVYMTLPRRPTLISLGAGAAIGIMWIVVPYEVTDYTPAYGALTGAALVGWLIARGIGTIVLVPIIEELFFRDYLESRLKGIAGPIVAGLVTASLFAVLHDRWMEAFVAGVIFSLVMAHRRQVIDAIASHAVANAIVYAYALVTMQMHII